MRTFDHGGVLATLLFVLLQSAAASALEQTTFVSVLGNDLNPCTRAAPCRNVGGVSVGAIAKTAPGGEVVILEPGDYGGTFTADRSITVTAVNGTAVFRGAVISPGAGGVVTLDGLHFHGANNAGVIFNSGAELRLLDCHFEDFSQEAIVVVTPAASKVLVSNCSIIGNGIGVRVQSTGGAAVVTLDNVQIEKNSTGILATTFAFPIGPASIVLLNNSLVTNNAVGLDAVNGGRIFSFGNNAIGGNGASDAPTLIPQQ
jgi:hypothetical protein